MTTRMLGLVLVVAGSVIMAAVSLAIGSLRGGDPPTPESPSAADGKRVKQTDRRRHSPLHY